MKNTLKNILVVLPFIAMGCQDETERITLESPQDTMGLKASSEEVALNQDLGNQEAISFTWGNAATRGEGTKLTYYFKMDIADNNFETSIAKVEIPEGVQSISYTHKEMNALLSGWKVTAGDVATLEAEVIAEVSGSEVYMKPEISKIQFKVTGYYVAPRDLFIVGTAVNGMDPAKALEMTEVLSEQKYEWSGHLQQGDFKFIKSQTSLTPSYGQGASANALVYNEAAGGSETLFHIDRAGYYVIALDVDALTITSEYPVGSEYTDIWVIGGATPAGWNVPSTVRLTKKNQVEFIYEGPLYEGELKFMLQNDKGFECDYLMAETNGASISSASSAKMVRKNYPNTNDANDAKWKVSMSEAGNYKITLDTYRMTITFEKQVGPEVPDDIPYKRIWIIGQPDNNWTLGQAQELSYDTSSRGIFVWEGKLSKGSFKFPVTDLAPGYGNLDYLMPAHVTNKKAPLTETGMQFAAKPDDAHDYQWEVTDADAGDYKISLDVLNMTIRFDKQ